MLTELQNETNKEIGIDLIKLIKNLTFYIPKTKNDDYLTIHDNRTMPIFLSEKEFNEFAKKYDYKDITYKNATFEQLQDSPDAKYYLINPLSDKIFLNKSNIDSMSEYEFKQIEDLVIKNYDIPLREMLNYDEKVLNRSVLNNIVKEVKIDKHFIEDNLEIIYNVPLMYPILKEKDKLIPYVFENKIMGFSNTEEYYKFMQDKDVKIEDTHTPYIGSLKYFLDEVTTNNLYIKINTPKGSIVLNEEDQEKSKNYPKSHVEYGYDIKIRLTDFEKITWRDLIIPAGITFEDLNEIIQTLLDFEFIHNYYFRIRKGDILIKDPYICDYLVRVGENKFYNQEEKIEKLKEIRDESGYDYSVEIPTTDVVIDPIFDNNVKIDYCYDMNYPWNIQIEIKSKIDYDKSYATIKRFKGIYNPIDDCRGYENFIYLLYKHANYEIGLEEEDFKSIISEEFLKEEWKDFKVNKFDMDKKQESLKYINLNETPTNY